jgi:hypothetical protein
MKKRDLAKELLLLEEEIETLEFTRTKLILLMEMTALLREPTSNVIDFPMPSRITTSRPAVGEWLARTDPSGSDRDDSK